MIDKEKLLKELQCLKEGCCHSVKTCKNRIDGVYQTQTECIASVIKNFPEEPAIDFDLLYEEYYKSLNIIKHGMPYFNARADGFCDFLKSKNISVPVKRELPVKTIYTLKKEYQDVFKDFGFWHSTFDTHSYEPLPENIKKYYDRTGEVDYSQMPKGSIVEVRIKGKRGFYHKFHSVNDDDGSINLYGCGESDCTFKLNKDDFIRVVEWDDNA